MSLSLLGEPRELGESVAAQGHILKCGMCAAYWLNDGSRPITISTGDARGFLPDLVEREQQAGL